MCNEPKQSYKYILLTKMLEIVLTPQILGAPKIGDPRLKPFEPNGKSAPDSNHRKSAFPPFVTLCDETKVQSGCSYLETPPEVRDH